MYKDLRRQQQMSENIQEPIEPCFRGTTCLGQQAARQVSDL